MLRKAETPTIQVLRLFFFPIAPPFVRKTAKTGFTYQILRPLLIYVIPISLQKTFCRS